MLGIPLQKLLAVIDLMIATISGSVLRFLFLVFLGVCVVQGATATDRGSANTQPNILLILLDDFGNNDLGYTHHGSSLTPNLDQLAAEGVRFTRHYVDSTCQATRVGMLTGRYPASLGFRPSGPGIEPGIATLPEILRGAGYATHHIGKWHLGFVSELAWPLQQGFDTFFGFLNQFLLRGPHAGDRYKLGRPTYRNPWLQIDNHQPAQKTGHLSDLLLERALAVIASKTSQSPPWFLNYWMYLPHTPLQPAERFASSESQDEEGRYRAMLRQADATIGALLRALDESGLADSTLVLVASDNGGTGKQLASNLPFTGEKASYGEGGIRTPLIARGPGVAAPGASTDQPVFYLDYVPTLAAVAGASLPDDLPGRNFLSAEPIAPFLYWESHNSESSAWAILDQTTNIKLHRYFVGGPVLSKVSIESAAADLDLDSESSVVGELRREFRRWRHDQRRSPGREEVLADLSGRQLPGNSFFQAPGFGGFTWIMGVQASADADAPEVLVDHPEFWSLRREQGQTRLQFLGQTLLLPPLPVSQCVQVAITSHHSHNLYRPDTSWSALEVYFDGQQVAERAVARPALPPDAYDNPIAIGQDRHGVQRFKGMLGPVFILNERLRADNQSDPWLANGIADVPRSDCSHGSADIVLGAGAW